MVRELIGVEIEWDRLSCLIWIVMFATARWQTDPGLATVRVRANGDFNRQQSLGGVVGVVLMGK